MSTSHDILVQCTRCKHQCMESEWICVPSKRINGCTEKTCPRCGCRSYYDMRPQVAWCWASGLIEVGDAMPADSADGGGAIQIATGPKAFLDAVINVFARHGYGEHAGKFIVPGVPEAGSQKEGCDALFSWLTWCAKQNGKKSSHGVVFEQGGF